MNNFFCSIVFLLATHSIVCMENNLGNTESQTIDVNGEGMVTITQTGSVIQHIVSDINIKQKLTIVQKEGDSYLLNLVHTPEKGLNGNFCGSAVNNDQFELKTTKYSIFYQGLNYPYDGHSMCIIKNGKLIVGKK